MSSSSDLATVLATRALDEPRQSSEQRATSRRSRIVAAPAELDMPMLPELVQRGKEAHIAVERRRAEAYEEGLARGLAEGRQRVEDESAARLARLVQLGDALGDAVSALRGREAAVAEHLAAELTTAALQLAEAVIEREVAAVPSVTIALERARGMAPLGVATTIRVHPDDAWAVAQAADRAGIEVVADDLVTPGGCVLVAGEATIDGSIDSAVRRVRSVLLGDDAGGSAERETEWR
jgi:flagellar assembly protein FliH